MNQLKVLNNYRQQEYFHRPYRRVYKVCNRYRIASKTLNDFGLKIINNDPKNATNIQGIRSHDNMTIITPKETNKIDTDKPFCCKFCGSEQLIKAGKHPTNKKQYYLCKTCNRRFIDNQYFEQMKASPKIICVTLDLYFKGISLRKITHHLKQFYDLDVHFTTVFNWINKYIIIMDEYVHQFKPQTSDIWNADEMMIKIDGDWFYLWNVIDDETRFHLASVVSKYRTKDDARKALITAKKRSHGKRPRYVITDGLKSYVQAVDDEFHTVKRETQHISNVGIRGKHTHGDIFDNNLVERLHGTIRERNKTQRGLKDEYSAFIRGHQVYYNFIRPHMSLFGDTPADHALINLNLGDKKWENLLMQSIKNKK